MSVEVVGLGYPLVDCIVKLDRIPASEELVQMSDNSWQGGGMVPTGLVTLSVLGASTGIIGIVGDDSFGAFCINDFKANGVDVSHLTVQRNATTKLSIVLSEKSTLGRSFIGKPGTHNRLRPDELDEAYIAEATYLLVSEMDDAAVRACEIARRNGVTVVVDANRYDERTVEHMHLFDVFIASEAFYRGICPTGEYEPNCMRISEMGPRTTVITLGKQGCVSLSDSTYRETPAFTDIDVVDTTGAGDVFHGAYIYGLLRGWSNERILHFSSAAAAIKCTRIGGRAGIPTETVVEEFLATGNIDYAQIDRRLMMYQKGMFC